MSRFPMAAALGRAIPFEICDVLCYKCCAVCPLWGSESLNVLPIDWEFPFNFAGGSSMSNDDNEKRKREKRERRNDDLRQWPVDDGPRCLFCQMPLSNSFDLFCAACDGD
jgi:hypothetical protein